MILQAKPVVLLKFNVKMLIHCSNDIAVMTIRQTDDCRIVERRGLIPPVIMMQEMPVTQTASETISGARHLAADIIQGRDDRLIVLVGPCSVHDVTSAQEYAQLLKAQRAQYADTLHIIMRVYFEKPRTTVGWKGLINDPYLDGSFQINQGLRTARSLLLDLSDSGLPCGTEFLDVVSPQYMADLISWGAIGARTTESQVHRELASGISAPIGFKNGTDGNVQIAIDAMRAAHAPHHFLSITKQGNTAIFTTAGNPDTHVILRGGKSGPNYDSDSIATASSTLAQAGVSHRVMVDCSHGNSCKDYRRQPKVCAEVAQQVSAGSQYILGVMIESHLQAGNQSIDAQPLVYGKSITDACVSWEMTLPMLEKLSEAVIQRRG